MPNPIRGTEIIPQLPQGHATGVAGDKTYLSGRSYNNLKTVSALTALAFEVARRVDGIIKNQPRDGRLVIDEMVTMEKPDYKATLFGDEQAEQPVLWKALELPAVAAAQAPVVEALPALAGLVRLETQVPNQLDLMRSVPIEKLSADLRRLATRIQLVLNADNQATTIALSDINAVISDPQRFLPEEQALFQRTKAEIESLIRREPSAMRAKLIVPEPGDVLRALPHQGQVGFTLCTRTVIHDDTPMSQNGYGQRVASGLPNGAVDRSQHFAVTVPTGCQAIIMNLQGDGEVLLDAGTRELHLEAGTHRVELWKNGQRLESSEVILPPLASMESVNLQTMLGVPMETAGGKALVRVDATVGSNPRQNVLRGEYVLDSQVGARQRHALGDWCTFNAALPTGVYRLPNRNETVHVYSSRLVAVFSGGVEVFLRPGTNDYASHRTGNGTYDRDIYGARGLPNGDPNQAALQIWMSGNHIGQISIADRLA